MIDLSFFIHLLNGLLMVGLPVGLAFYLTRRFKLGWRLWWIGAATFILSQAGHIPFNAILTQLFQAGRLPSPPHSWLPYFNPVILGLSAGLFEEFARAGVYLWWAKDARSWRRGVLMGAGHGGAEAIILGVLALYTLLQVTAYRTANLAAIFSGNQLALAQQQIQTYWSASWTASLLGAVERFFTLPIQICLAVIVLQAFVRRNPAWIGLAVAWHAAVDGVSVYLGNMWQGQPWSGYANEGVIGIFAVVSILILLLLRKAEPEPEPDHSDSVHEPMPVQAIRPVGIDEDLSPEAIEESRYTH